MDQSLLKATLIWCVFSATAITLRYSTLKKKKEVIKKLIFELLKVIVVVQFIVNLHPFSLIGELIIIPFVTIAFLLHSFASEKEEYKIVKKFLGLLLFIWGIYVLGYSIYQIGLNLKSDYQLKTLLDYILPFWLSLTFIPFLLTLKKVLIWEEKRTLNKLRQNR